MEKKDQVFTEKIEPLMKLVMEYCEKEGISLYADFKINDSSRYYCRVGDTLLDTFDIFTQLQLYEARHGKTLI